MSAITPSFLTQEVARAIAEELRRKSRSIAFVNGCFDPLHHGHIQLLRFAKSQADVLFVGINSDVGIRSIKGADRPRFPLDHRACSLSELRCVDYIVSFDESSASQLIRLIRPTLVVKGSDYDYATTIEREAIADVDARLVFADLIQGVSSTKVSKYDVLSSSMQRHVHLLTDFALDTYLTAEVEGISREFPIVVCVNPKEQSMLGGGGNLAESLNRQCVLDSIFGALGESETDNKIRAFLEELRVQNLHIARADGSFCTHYRKIVGKHLGSDNREILRMDDVYERSNMKQIWASVTESVAIASIKRGDIIVVSAYEDIDRSTVGPPVRGFLRELAINRGAILIGSCRSSCTTLRGFDTIVINEYECLRALSMGHAGIRVTAELVRMFAELVAPSRVVITIGERGAFFCDNDSIEVISVNTSPCPPGTDPTGAGDVFLAAFVGAVSRGFLFPDCVEYAVRTATHALHREKRPAVAAPILEND